jgi:hypothetical protein
MKRTLGICIGYLVMINWITGLRAQTLVLTVLANQMNVPMNTPSHYESGNTVTTVGAVRVSASVRWDLSVKASGALSNGAYSIPCNSFGIQVTNAQGNAQPERMLAITDQKIVDSAPSTFIALVDFPVLLNIAIRATGGTNFLNKPEGTYSTTLTYTLTAD